MLPDTPEAIDADWLTAVLAERFPGVRVASIDIVETHELTNLHARLRVTYHEPAGAPTAMFCKLPPLDPARRESIAGTGMGRREARFYAQLAGSVTMRVPVDVFQPGRRDGWLVRPAPRRPQEHRLHRPRRHARDLA